MGSPTELSPTAQIQRRAAVTLIVIQAIAIGVLMQALVFAISVATIALVALVAPRYRLLRTIDRTRWFVLTGILFGIKAVFAPTEFDFNINFVNTALAYEVAGFCIVLQLLSLFMQRYSQRLPLWILGLSLVALIFAADVRVNGFRRTAMLVIVTAFLFAWTAFASASRQPVNQERRRSWTKFLLTGGVLCLAVLLTAGVATALHRHERELESALTAYLALGEPTQAETGFSGRGGLSDVTEWKKAGGNTLALRVISRNTPGYLRGKVFDTFEKQRWSLQTETLPLHPIDTERAPQVDGSRGACFVLRSDSPTSATVAFSEGDAVLQVWPIDDNGAGHFFLPLETVAFWSVAERVVVDQHQIPTRPDRGVVHPYTALTRADVQRHHGPVDSLYTELPDSVDDRVEQAVAELQISGKSNREKIAAIRSFFQSQFKYKLGIRIPRGEDRLGYFVSNRVPAHCEYFASATTVMLRLAGVPARYVTGYVCQEKNAVDGSWLARRQDAHAWVEAYDDVTGRWLIVESTPADGVPAERRAGVRANLLESLMHRVRELQYRIKSGDVWGLLYSLLMPVLYLMGFVVVILVVWQLRGLFRKRHVHGARSTILIDPRLIAERKRMDRYVARFGLQREEHESLKQFAERIAARVTIPEREQIAAWYLTYVSVRFGGKAAIDQELHQLSDARASIMSRRRSAVPVST